jgi:hypothetical protein
MKHLKLFIFISVSVLAFSSNAQSRVEKLGLAVGGYYGAAANLKIVSDGKCKNFFKINSNEYDLSILRSNINKTLLPILSKSDYFDLQEMYGTIERDSLIHSNDFLRAPENKCKELADELTKIYQNKKAIWSGLVK